MPDLLRMKSCSVGCRDCLTRAREDFTQVLVPEERGLGIQHEVEHGNFLVV